METQEKEAVAAGTKERTAERKRAAAGPVPVDSLLNRLRAEFPFPDYFYLTLESHRTFLNAVRQWVPRGGRVLDIGCGPLDKTALLAWDGYDCIAVDDLRDEWHRTGDNLKKITGFARKTGVDLTVSDGETLPANAKNMDAVVMLDVIEHLHASPKALMEAALGRLKSGGVIIITVPSAVNLRKRLDVLRGRTNYPPYKQFFDAPVWRGHVREYAKDDLRQLANFMNLEILELRGIDQMLGVLPAAIHKPYLFFTRYVPDVKDSWLLVVRKP